MLAPILMGKDRSTFAMQPFVPVGVIEVPVRVDQMSDRRLIKA
jgi:hypothetical protein